MSNRFFSDEDFAAVEAAGVCKLNGDTRALLDHACLLQMEEWTRNDNASQTAKALKLEISRMEDGAVSVLSHVERLCNAHPQDMFEGRDQIASAFYDACILNSDALGMNSFKLHEILGLLKKYAEVLHIAKRNVISDLSKKGRPKSIPQRFVTDMAAIYEKAGGNPTANNSPERGKPDGPFIRFVLEVARRGLRLSERQLRTWPDSLRNFSRYHDGLCQVGHSFRHRRVKTTAKQ